MPRPRGLVQSYSIRDFAAAEVEALRDAPVNSPAERLARARALRDLAFVWNCASDRIRILRGRGLPKSVEPSRTRKARAFTTPPPPLPAEPSKAA